MANLIDYRNKFYVTLTVRGIRKKVSTRLEYKKENLAKAKLIKKRIEEEIELPDNKKLTSKNYVQFQSEISLKSSIEKFIDDRMGTKSFSHLKNFRLSMNYFLKVIPDSTPISKITSTDLSRVINLLNESVSNASLHTYLRYINMLLNYFVEEDYILKSPMRKKNIPKKERKNIQIFEKRDIDKILDIAKERDVEYYNGLMFLLLTGLRPNDMLNLRVGDIDLEGNIAKFKISKTKKEIIFPIYDKLKNFLCENMSHKFNQNKNELVFKEFTVETLGKRFSRIKRHLKLSDAAKYNLKTFRKTFASDMLELGATEAEVASMLGHDSVQTTRSYYAKVNTVVLKRKINELMK